jgi:hypothetical protein
MSRQRQTEDRWSQKMLGFSDENGMRTYELLDRNGGDILARPAPTLPSPSMIRDTVRGMHEGRTLGYINGKAAALFEVYADTIERYVRYAPASSQDELRQKCVLWLSDRRNGRYALENLGKAVYSARQMALTLGGKPPDIFSFLGEDGGYDIPPPGIFSRDELVKIGKVARKKGLYPTGCRPDDPEPQAQDAAEVQREDAPADPESGPAEGADPGDEGHAPQGFGAGLG